MLMIGFLTVSLNSNGKLSNHKHSNFVINHTLQLYFNYTVYQQAKRTEINQINRTRTPKVCSLAIKRIFSVHPSKSPAITSKAT